MTLGPLGRKHRYQAIDLRIEYTKALYEPTPEDLRPEREPNEDEEDYRDRVSIWEKSMRVVQQPEPKTFSPKDIRCLDLRKDYKDKGLQVIVKIASIELTPEKPTYEGGSWHVEGQMNEHICATALYYFSSYNITDSRLAFRQESRYEEGDIGYEQDHIEWLVDIFGCEQNGPLLQEVGDVLCKEGRLLTFPNILQHRVRPFQLADPTKPGYYKIIALLLVYPNIQIISTENIPPQREDWLHKMDSSRTLELHNNVFNIGEAKEWRAELMEERKAFIDEHNSALAQETFSLCEH
ncbi:hypothetical protein ETB97_004260 [Aspergillus alliaceus]|uniref:DUF4246 domain-containing protein n=1 Tax=Petromyces alliaceus TaxID=209559 RepID=A0A8H6A281_PETAA|nr:hypothetical protein ETB97_004260 [Aspergillus burnettii]